MFPLTCVQDEGEESLRGVDWETVKRHAYTALQRGLDKALPEQKPSTRTHSTNTATGPSHTQKHHQRPLSGSGGKTGAVAAPVGLAGAPALASPREQSRTEAASRTSQAGRLLSHTGAAAAVSPLLVPLLRADSAETPGARASGDGAVRDSATSAQSAVGVAAAAAAAAAAVASSTLASAPGSRIPSHTHTPLAASAGSVGHGLHSATAQPTPPHAGAAGTHDTAAATTVHIDIPTTANNNNLVTASVSDSDGGSVGHGGRDGGMAGAGSSVAASAGTSSDAAAGGGAGGPRARRQRRRDRRADEAQFEAMMAERAAGSCFFTALATAAAAASADGGGGGKDKGARTAKGLRQSTGGGGGGGGGGETAHTAIDVGEGDEAPVSTPVRRSGAGGGGVGGSGGGAGGDALNEGRGSPISLDR